jgi:tartrate-resistant acid phosphatase type 5
MKTAITTTVLSVATATQPPFLVMGDWGGQVWPPYTTSMEIATASGMGKVASNLSSTFALALGDNFYDHGVASVTDTRFKDTFEDVFTAPSLQSPFNFRVIAGNHDHRGNVTAQIDYEGVSDRWNFPSLYYTFTEGDVQFVMIDTVTLTGNSDLEDGTELSGAALPGPPSKEAADVQMEWIQTTLAESKSKYLIVAGHYPVYSICEHGPTPLLISQLKPMLVANNVTAYMNGHDHCAQYIDVGDGVQYHTIGSAHENNPSTAHQNTVTKEQLMFHTGVGLGGFASVAVEESGLTVVHRDGSGKILYTAPLQPPRSVQETEE